MKLEQQVVSLELAQKLKKLGVKQESYFGWVRTGENNQEWKVEASFGHGYSAFTVAELGQMLPSYIRHDTYDQLYMYCYKDDANMWRVTYTKWGMMKEFEIEKQDTEADARAKMLVYLLENELITL